MRINRGQEFVVGGFIPGPARGRFNRHRLLSREGLGVRRQSAKWICASNPQNGLRETEAACHRQIPVRESAGDWTRPMGRDFRRREDEAMRLGPSKLVAVIEFLEGTEGDRLRHSKFVALREDKNPRAVVQEA
jgi:ATP-dependent DNA ligase